MPIKLTVLTLLVTVWIKAGICTADSIINLALCLLGYIPGLIHAWYIILKYPEPDYDEAGYEPVPGDANQQRDVENGRVTYYYVSQQPLQHPSQRAYGTVDPRVQQPPADSQQETPKPSDHAEGNGESSSGQAQGDSRPPPTYAEAVRGDNKVQT